MPTFSLVGPLPASWSTLTALTVVDLSQNQLSSTLPVTWQNLQALIRLDLSSNSFRSTVPADWQSGTPNMAALTRLSLSTNPNM